MINIDNLIKEAFVSLKESNTEENKFRLNTLKIVKSKFLEFKTSKEGVKKLIVLPDGTKEISDTDKISLLNKMVKELNDGADEMEKAKPSLAEEYRKQASIISEFLPKAATEDEILEVIKEYITNEINGNSMQKSDMGKCIKYVKDKLLNSDGKVVSKLVMSFIH